MSNCQKQQPSEQDIGPTFNPQTFKTLFESVWKEQAKIKPEVLDLCAEYFRIMTHTCIDRAISKAETDQNTQLNEQYLRKILIQALLDFR
mmetsp:Transcript_67031/g.106593  ORF Transcript_67031/g.106593 Transcript_67031/m.106593 type:complete len:90 (+) Transcript_67031:36-305(+)